MTDDDLFRWLMIAGAAVLLPIGIYHRLRAHTGEKIDRLQEPLYILIGVRLIGLVGAIGLVNGRRRV